MSTDQPPTLFVGIDWATQENQLCVLDAEGTVVGERSFDNDGAGLAETCAWLLGFEADAVRIAVAIEVPHGPVVETLLEWGFVVHSINPKQLDRFRDRFTLAGAKDDRLDARVLGSSLRTDAHAFRRLRMDEPTVLELREWSRMADDLKEERNRLTNRVRQQLRRYYPQLLDVGPDPGADWFLDLWQLMPFPARARRTQRRSIERVLRKHRIRRIDADEVRELVKRPAVTVAPGTTEAASVHIQRVAARLRLVNQQLKEAHRELDRLIAELCADEEPSPGKRSEQHDAAILRSLPGVGRIVLAVLLAEASQAIAARDYQALRALCGVAPVTRRSGKRKLVVMRQACHPRLRDAVYHWSRVATQNDEIARRAYTALRARGHSHGRALRSVADRLLRVACAMLRDRSAYDTAKRARAA